MTEPSGAPWIFHILYPQKLSILSFTCLTMVNLFILIFLLFNISLFFDILIFNICSISIYDNANGLCSPISIIYSFCWFSIIFSCLFGFLVTFYCVLDIALDNTYRNNLMLWIILQHCMVLFSFCQSLGNEIWNKLNQILEIEMIENLVPVMTSFPRVQPFEIPAWTWVEVYHDYSSLPDLGLQLLSS